MTCLFLEYVESKPECKMLRARIVIRLEVEGIIVENLTKTVGQNNKKLGNLIGEK